jgi:hypothetical protein
VWIEGICVCEKRIMKEIGRYRLVIVNLEGNSAKQSLFDGNSLNTGIIFKSKESVGVFNYLNQSKGFNSADGKILMYTRPQTACMYRTRKKHKGKNTAILNRFGSKNLRGKNIMVWKSGMNSYE